MCYRVGVTTKRAKPTAEQERVIRYFAHETVTQTKNPATLDRTYRICEARGWIEQTETYPYHRTTAAGKDAIR